MNIVRVRPTYPCIPALAQTGATKLRLTEREQEALAFLVPLSGEYPAIESWFTNKVVPGLRTESRLLHRIERDGTLVGLGIAKREPGENKICTVRVSPLYEGRGHGLRIFDALLKWLDVDKPHLTIGQRKLPAFERVFEWYGFNITSVRHGQYTPNQNELGYNEGDHL
ncbi:hypothetical protein K32_13090 [Kaistia sp. 32K]|uniref:GNAT family N-acetyltransferase n=1 Tax=Kaistia sp. 32K TaxID=2795690 RepID=UPI0019158858|nr:GNAT family N-acetyltransferase [Kaistia sp. 32K]BCP52692.1 hypothetical protein K32_13090 [Kaistia sp. 32K]